MVVRTVSPRHPLAVTTYLAALLLGFGVATGFTPTRVDDINYHWVNEIWWSGLVIGGALCLYGVITEILHRAYACEIAGTLALFLVSVFLFISAVLVTDRPLWTIGGWALGFLFRHIQLIRERHRIEKMVEDG